MQHETPLLTTSAAARLIGVAEGTIRQMERRGDLAAVRTETGTRLFERAEVERVAERRRAHAAA